MSDGQHVGPMKSEIGGDFDTAAIERARQLAKSVKPRALGPKYREGDGPLCPEEGDHGKTYVMSSGNLWCPVSQSLFGRGATPGAIGPLIRQGDHPREATHG